MKKKKKKLKKQIVKSKNFTHLLIKAAGLTMRKRDGQRNGQSLVFTHTHTHTLTHTWCVYQLSGCEQTSFVQNSFFFSFYFFFFFGNEHVDFCRLLSIAVIIVCFCQTPSPHPLPLVYRCYILCVCNNMANPIVGGRECVAAQQQCVILTQNLKCFPCFLAYFLGDQICGFMCMQ